MGLTPDLIAELRAALQECAEDLAVMIEAHYPKHPDGGHYMEKRYQRDMEPVKRARVLLCITDPHP